MLQFDWNFVEPTVVLDWVYGLDFCFSFLGYVVAIDVTADPEEVDGKLDKRFMLKELCQSVNIEKTAVCLVQEGIGEPSLKPLLKQIIRGSKFIELAA